MDTRTIIVETFAKVAQEQGRPLLSLRDESLLLDTGLDSLCFAIIVTRLEDTLGVDPFSADETLFPVSFGEFVRLYESCAKQVQ